ncbi:MAG: hypothetical protein KY453_08155 [Gemmatimonadetes bacterium]|nr:hypothetical protein [Gemmatimonadota bacterium]
MSRSRPGGGAERPAGAAGGARVLLLPGACALLLLAFATLIEGRPGLYPAFLGAGAVLLAWAAALLPGASRQGEPLTLTVALRKHHWVQALAQITVLLYWGWHVRFVYAFLPLIAAQIIFAYGVDSLLSWSRRRTYALGFGPFPVILSINLFLWLRPEWFQWQFVMIAVGYLGKDLIRWNRDGRSAHIFNPSSLPLALFAVALIVTGSSDITLGQAIATSQYYPPNMYLVIFLAALPGQLLFGVARMTMPAVVTAYLISVVYFQATGTYLFFDSHIPVPVFLGMHLLFTDPSTAPRSESGRIAFGVLYGAGTTFFYVVLGALGVPTFYDKLLPVPLLNLMVRRIDRIAAGPFAALRGPAVPSRAPLTSKRRNLAYTFAWAAIFVALTAVRGVGDTHRGQALPFWREVCEEGNNARACEYAATKTGFYCGDGSGWACNELGLLRLEDGQNPTAAFRRACDLGFEAGCENVRRLETGARALRRAPPRAADLPIVLRGTKPPLTDWSAEALHERACDQGWDEVCRRGVSGD